MLTLSNIGALCLPFLERQKGWMLSVALFLGFEFWVLSFGVFEFLGFEFWVLGFEFLSFEFLSFGFLSFEFLLFAVFYLYFFSV